MKRIKFIFWLFKIIFNKPKNEGIVINTKNHIHGQDSFYVYSISSGQETYTVLVSYTLNNKHSVSRFEFTEHEFLSLGIINESRLIKAIKVKQLKTKN